MKRAGTFPALLEAYFVDRLIRQRQVSQHTLASYRDTFRLMLEHALRQLGKAPSALTLADLDAPFSAPFSTISRKPRQQRPQPQCPSRRHPFLLPLCCPSRART